MLYLKDHVTLKTGVMAAEITASPSQEYQYHFKIYKNKKWQTVILNY